MTIQFEYSPQKEKTDPNLTVVHFAGSKVLLDQETLQGIHDQLLALADNSSESNLLLDFGNVEYLCGAVLGTLVSLHNKLVARKRHLTVGNLTPQVHEVFAIMRLDRFLDLHLAGKVVAAAAHDSRQHRWIKVPCKGG
jgi:anti-anti-sigma factor